MGKVLIIGAGKRAGFCGFWEHLDVVMWEKDWERTTIHEEGYCILLRESSQQRTVWKGTNKGPEVEYVNNKPLSSSILPLVCFELKYDFNLSRN